MEAGERRLLVERYREGPGVLEAAVARLSASDLDRRPADGWSPRMIVHHTADSELTSAIRLRRLLAEDVPVIQGYDQELFARVLNYERRPVEPSLLAVRAARESSAQMLELLDEAGWQRAGTHSESGRYSVEDWLRIYAAHCHDHARQIAEVLSGEPAET